MRDLEASIEIGIQLLPMGLSNGFLIGNTHHDYNVITIKGYLTLILRNDSIKYLLRHKTN